MNIIYVPVYYKNVKNSTFFYPVPETICCSGTSGGERGAGYGPVDPFPGRRGEVNYFLIA